MRPIPAVHSSIISSRSLTANSGSLDGLATTATISSSKMRRLRSMRSRCPLWMGSNIPGYTARLPTHSPVAGVNSRQKSRSVYAGDRKKVKVVSPNRRAFHTDRTPGAADGGDLVGCWRATTAEAASTAPAETAARAGAPRGDA